MKNIFLTTLILGMGLLSGRSALAAEFRLNEHVYDTVYRTVMYIESIDHGYYYVRYFRGNETSYPRYANELSKSIDSLHGIHVGMDVSYFNANNRKWEHDTVRYVFANGIAWFDGTLGVYGVGVDNLGVAKASIPGVALKVGDVACPIQRTTHYRKPGSRGVVTKLYDNGAALMKFKDFLVINAWEVVPFDNLTEDCKK